MNVLGGENYLKSCSTFLFFWTDDAVNEEKDLIVAVMSLIEFWFNLQCLS